jgi:cyanophycin synthetase
VRPLLTDSRRLTGPNLFWDRPSAIIDIAVDDSPGELIAAWQSAARHWLDIVGYSEQELRHRTFDGGASLLISAPIDVLYSMCELNEVAWGSALHACGFGEAPDAEEEGPRLNRLFDEERNPPLLALQAAALAHGVPFLWDDDEVSVGYGRTVRIWPPDRLPTPDSIDWAAVRAIPVAMVTGTNGKSTTVRMTAAIMTAAGHRTGLTSTDFIRAGDRLIDRGDYSGTGGARTLMRQPDVEMAVLEVARGGLLRRGLGLDHVEAAVVTNVAADHLGEYGINSVEELIPAKFIVRRALGPNDPLILNADDPGVVAFSRTLGNRLWWFSLDAGNPQVTVGLSAGGSACFLEDGWLVRGSGNDRHRVVRAEELPATRGGIVRYNIANALAAMSVASALGIDDSSIRNGLVAFRGDESDNPGRGNWFEHEISAGGESGPVRILVDFAHNEHGMRALAETVRQVGAERIVLLMGQAGDRLDKDIADLVQAACSMGPDRLLIAELPGYERGREPFEVPRVIHREALANGIAETSIELFPDPAGATAQALAEARPGDLLVLLALTRRDEALSLVHEFIERSGAENG